MMMKGGCGQTNQLHDINWGALDHASRVPQLMSFNYGVCVTYVHQLCAHTHIFSLLDFYHVWFHVESP